MKNGKNTTRSLSSRICESRTVDQLSDAEEVFLLRLLSKTDQVGRYTGDPELLANYLYPRSRKLDPEAIEGILEKLVDLGTIDWYVVDGDRYIAFRNFERHHHFRSDVHRVVLYPGPDEAESHVLPAADERADRTPPDEPGRTRTDPDEAGRTRAYPIPGPGPIPGPTSGGAGDDNGREPRHRGSGRERPGRPADAGSTSGGDARASPPETGDSLQEFVTECFARHSDVRGWDWRREGGARRRLIAHAHRVSPGEPQRYLLQLIETFWELREGGGRFWRGQPWLISILASHGILPRVEVAMRQRAPPSADETVAEVAAARERIRRRKEEQGR